MSDQQPNQTNASTRQPQQPQTPVYQAGQPPKDQTPAASTHPQTTDPYPDLDPAWIQSNPAPQPVADSQPSANPSPHQDPVPQPQPSGLQPDHQLPAGEPEPALIDLPRPSQTQPISIAPSPEHEPVAVQTPETAPLVEVGVEEELDPEVREYMQRVEKDKLALDQPIVMHGQPVVQPAHWPGQAAMPLPTTRDKAIAGLKAKVTDSIRWLATWCVRMFKKFQGKVIYSDAQQTDS